MTWRLPVLSLSLALITCASPVDASSAPAAQPDPDATNDSVDLAIVDATVLPMDRDVVLPRQTIIVHDGRIAALGEHLPIPAGATVVNAAGRYVMPGLIDMHVHILESADLSRYLAAGVTTVRNMWGFPQIITWQREIAAGLRAGPEIISASPGVDAPPSQWPAAQFLTDPAMAESLVVHLQNQGWPYIKVYTQLSLPAFDALAIAARKHGIPIIGHVPLAVPVVHAMDAGLQEIEHLSGYDMAVSASGRSGTWGWIDAVPARFASLALHSAQAGTWNCPTLAIYAELARQHSAAERDSVIQHRGQFVRALAAAGAPLLIGTDAGIGVMAPGSSLHDELKEFVAAGFTPYEALHIATTEAARSLGRRDIGTVALGAVADLLLLTGNPTLDIAKSSTISGVVSRGAWTPVPRAEPAPAIK